MEWVPNRDKDKVTAKLAVELILALLGVEYSPYT